MGLAKNESQPWLWRAVAHLAGARRISLPIIVRRRHRLADILRANKMGKMASDPEEQHKKVVGELWASRSDGRCRFGWIVDKNWPRLAEALDG